MKTTKPIGGKRRKEPRSPVSLRQISNGRISLLNQVLTRMHTHARARDKGLGYGLQSTYTIEYKQYSYDHIQLELNVCRTPWEK